MPSRRYENLKEWALIVPMAALTGSVCAAFLWSLDEATGARYRLPWLLFFLPLVGVLVAWAYERFGGRAMAGNNLIIDEIHEPRGGVPLRMAPMILASTVATHLAGGSAGREGTAVQLGGSLAGELARRFHFSPASTRLLLMSGIAAGFGAVFGTPLAGAVFAMEVLTRGRLEYRATAHCLLAALIAHLSCLAWGIHHTDYHIGIFQTAATLSWNWGVLGRVALASLGFGLASRLFIGLNHGTADLVKRIFPTYWVRPIAGGLAVVSLAYLVGSVDYLGLGVTSPHGGVSILSSFQAGGAGAFSWLWKILFTALTLGTGFKGGEVTPLFFIGASLGNALATALGAPVDLLAGLGFVAVFAGATNTPLACIVMGAELFGPSALLYLVLACVIAHAVSGKESIYKAQRSHNK